MTLAGKAYIHTGKDRKRIPARIGKDWGGDNSLTRDEKIPHGGGIYFP